MNGTGRSRWPFSPKGLERFDYLIKASGNKDLIPTLIECSKRGQKFRCWGSLPKQANKKVVSMVHVHEVVAKVL